MKVGEATEVENQQYLRNTVEDNRKVIHLDFIQNKS